MATLVLDGRSIEFSQVGTNDGLNCGRFGEHEALAYDFSATADEIIPALSSAFDELVAEMRGDDALDSAPSALQRMGYPTLREAFGHPMDLAEVVKTFLHREILGHFLPFNDQCQFVINSTDRVDVTNSTLHLSGRCFRRP